MPALITESQVDTPPPKVWTSLVKRCLPPAESRDVDFWWKLTGYHLAVMIDAAGYSLDKQYEVLLFHYHWIVPRLGPAPHPDGRPVFKSLIAYDGSPLEYSWKWNTTTGEPDIRYSWEAIGPNSGTAADPLNHGATLEYMEKMPSVLPNVDFSWYRHFLRELYNPDRSGYARELEQGNPQTTTLMHAVEYNKEKSFGLKSYIIPQKLLKGGDPATAKEWDDAIIKLNPDGNHPGRDALQHFLTNNPEGRAMKVVIMGMDNVKPSKSRLKMYYSSAHTSFNAVREIMTMGGTRDIPESSLQDLRSMILAVLGLPSDFPDDQEIPLDDNVDNYWLSFATLRFGFTFFFDIAPTSGTPDVKFYLPTRKWGADDLTIARNLTAWMRAHGRGAYADQYMGMLEKLAVHRGLENGKGLHAYISYQCVARGEPDIKSYIAPELFHKARYTAEDAVVRKIHD
ncbi:MAG: hypothetical protein Q9165_001870 [Trypethelium subeluteriae]